MPTFLVGGWFDLFLPGTVANYQALVANAPDKQAARSHRLLIGPWGHSMRAGDGVGGEISLGPDADLDLLDLERRWFDHWLQGAESDELDEPRVRYYTMGANVWRTCCKWPPGGVTYIPYYLHGPDDRDAPQANAGGRLTLQMPRWDPPQRYVYNPQRPVPTRCGNVFGLPWGSYDQRPVTGEARDDVLSFTSDRLTEPLEVTGPLRVVLYATSSATDTDFTAKLIDIQPDGRRLNIQDGIVRARYRHGPGEPPQLLEPGRISRLEVDLSATSYLVRPGHRLRVDISSSNFPRFDRNANTGNAVGSDRRQDVALAHQTIFHDASRPSHLLLPVMGQQ